MNKKSKIAVCSGAAALALLGAFTAQMHGRSPVSEAPKIPSVYSLTCEKTTSPHIGQEPAPQPKVRPVTASAQGDRVTPPHEPKHTRVGEETANVEPISVTPTQIAFEPPEPRGGSTILKPQESPRDKPTPSTTATQAPSHHAPVEPQMCDSRTVDGQKQVYILGFGWIDDNDEPNVGIVVDGDGDINKMVGTMD